MDAVASQHQRSRRSPKQRGGALDCSGIRGSGGGAVGGRSQHRVDILVDLLTEEFGGELEVDGPWPTPEGVAKRLSQVFGDTPRLGNDSGELGDRPEQLELRDVLKAVATYGLVRPGGSLSADHHHGNSFTPGVDHARKQVGNSWPHATHHHCRNSRGPRPGVGHVDLGTFMPARYNEHSRCLGLDRERGE